MSQLLGGTHINYTNTKFFRSIFRESKFLGEEFPELHQIWTEYRTIMGPLNFRLYFR